MKRFLFPILSLLLVLALCACQAGPVAGTSSNPVSSEPTSSTPEPFFAEGFSQTDRNSGMYGVRWLTITRDTCNETSHLDVIPLVKEESVELASDGSVLAEKLQVGMAIQPRSKYSTIKQLLIYRADENGNKINTPEAKLVDIYDLSGEKSILIDQVKLGEKFYLTYTIDVEKERHTIEAVFYWEMVGSNALCAKYEKRRESILPIDRFEDPPAPAVNLEVDAEISEELNNMIKGWVAYRIDQAFYDWETYLPKIPEEFLSQITELLPQVKRFFNLSELMAWGVLQNGSELFAVGMTLEDGTTHIFIWNPLIKHVVLADDWVSGLIWYDSIIGIKADGTMERAYVNYNSENENEKYSWKTEVFHPEITDVVAIADLSHWSGICFLQKDGTLLHKNDILCRIIDENVVKIETPDAYGHSTSYLKSNNQLIRYNYTPPTGELKPEIIAIVDDWTQVSTYYIRNETVYLALKDGTTQTIELKASSTAE